MARSLIVIGPQGCGKTTHAETILKKFGLSKVVDGWTVGDPIRFRETLYLTCESFRDVVHEMDQAPIRIMTFDQALK